MATKKKPAKRKPGRPQGAKNVTVIERMNAVETMLLANYTDHMVATIGERQWKVTAKTVRGYLKAVRDRWIEEAETGRTARKAAAVQRLKAISRDANKDDIRGRTRVELAIAEIEGTKAPEKIEQIVKVEATEALNAIARAIGMNPKEFE